MPDASADASIESRVRRAMAEAQRRKRAPQGGAVGALDGWGKEDLITSASTASALESTEESGSDDDGTELLASCWPGAVDNLDNPPF